MKSSIPVITIKKLIIKVVVDAKFKGGVCMLFGFTFVALQNLFVVHSTSKFSNASEYEMNGPATAPQSSTIQ